MYFSFNRILCICYTSWKCSGITRFLELQTLKIQHSLLLWKLPSIWERGEQAPPLMTFTSAQHPHTPPHTHTHHKTLKGKTRIPMVSQFLEEYSALTCVLINTPEIKLELGGAVPDTHPVRKRSICILQVPVYLGWTQRRWWLRGNLAKTPECWWPHPG